MSEEDRKKDAVSFIEEFWTGLHGYGELELREKDSDGERTGAPVDTKWFQLPGDLNSGMVQRWVMRNLEDDLYFTPNSYKRPVRQESEVNQTNFVYADDDGVTGQYRVPPSAEVTTSIGHKHIYWKLDAPVDSRRIKRVGFEIAAAHRHDNEAHGDMKADHKHCGTDPGGWDLVQILRVSGSKNKKNPFVEQIVTWETRDDEDGNGLVSYTLEGLEAAYPQTDAKVSIELPEDHLPDEIPDHKILLDRLSGRGDLIALWMNAPGPNEDWSTRLHALLNALFRQKFTPEEVYSLAWTAQCNKWRRGSRNTNGTFTAYRDPELKLWADVRKAWVTHTEQPDFFAYETIIDAAQEGVEEDGTPINPVYRAQHDRLETVLLTPEERDAIKGLRTLVDTYVEWASQKTDAAKVYHIGAIFSIMSLVFGEFGHVEPRFGRLRLNLWFLIAGRTTRSRKSTALKLMLSILSGIQESNHFWYNEGSNFTGEGIDSRLAAKDRRSTLIYKDEIQGLFKEAGAKGYMTGLLDKLTDLYDGRVSGKLRSGSTDETAEFESNFCFFGMGIVDKITSVLTNDDYDSGFAPRFIHVLGETPPKTKESEYLPQMDHAATRGIDPLYQKLMNDILMARTAWEMKVPDYRTVGIRFSDDAWERWNDMKWRMQEIITGTDREKVLEAAVDRLSISVMKASALLAMSDGREQVEVYDVLIAAQYAERWLQDLFDVSERVAESFWKKDLNNVHDLILRKGGRILWQDAYAASGKKPNEFEQMVNGMILSGMITVMIGEEDKKQWLIAK